MELKPGFLEGFETNCEGQLVWEFGYLWKGFFDGGGWVLLRDLVKRRRKDYKG